MKVKQSFYNFIVKDEKREKFIIYNSRTGALALITIANSESDRHAGV